MSNIDLNAVVVGIVNSMPNKRVDNNFLTDTNGRVLKALTKEIHLWHTDIMHMPNKTYFTFQPFHELVTHEDSPSLLYLNKMINIELNSLLIKAIPAVMQAALDIKTPSKRQREIFGEDTSKLSEKTIKFVTSVLANVKLSNSRRGIVDVSLRTNHPITRENDDHKYAVLKSPLMHDIAYHSGKDKLFDATVHRKDDKEILRTILRALLPADFDSTYFVGSKHSLVPRNKCLHDIYQDVIDHINDALTTLKITGVEVPTIDENWTKGLTMMANLLQGVPRDIYGAAGEVKVGVSVPKEDTRVIPSSGFGANQNPMGTPSTVGTGGLLGQVNAMMHSQLSPMFHQNVPSGYVLVPAQGMGVSPGFGGVMGHGQPNSSIVSAPASSSVPAGGLMNMTQP